MILLYFKHWGLMTYNTDILSWYIRLYYWNAASVVHNSPQILNWYLSAALLRKFLLVTRKYTGQQSDVPSLESFEMVFFSVVTWLCTDLHLMVLLWRFVRHSYWDWVLGRHQKESCHFWWVSCFLCLPSAQVPGNVHILYVNHSILLFQQI